MTRRTSGPARFSPQGIAVSAHHGAAWRGRRTGMGQGGFEPPTPRLSSVCSNQLSYWPPGFPPQGETLERIAPGQRPRAVQAGRVLYRGKGYVDGAGRAVSALVSGAPPASAGGLIGGLQTPARKPDIRRPSLKGGDPAAGSPTATLLRLHPSR